MSDTPFPANTPTETGDSPLVHQELEIDEELELHNRGWWWQQCLWALLGLLLIGALLGLFGGGPLSKQALHAADTGQWLEYDRFARKHAPVELVFHVVSPPGGTATVRIPTGYLAKFQIETVSPQPSAVATQQGQVIYSFRATGAFTLTYHLRPGHAGSLAADVHVNANRFHLHHVIYP